MMSKRIQARKGWAENAGLGFHLPEFCSQCSKEAAFSLHKKAARGVTIWELKSFGRLAQRLEHPVYTRKVVRSNRTLPTN
jgi:hypothetical protein